METAQTSDRTPLSHEHGTNIQAPSGLIFGAENWYCPPIPVNAVDDVLCRKPPPSNRPETSICCIFPATGEALKKQGAIVLIGQALALSGGERNADVPIAGIRIGSAFARLNCVAGGETGGVGDGVS